MKENGGELDEEWSVTTHNLEGKSGKNYQLQFKKATAQWIFKVYSGDTTVADANCLFFGSKILLGDICVRDRARAPLNSLYRRLRAFMHLRAAPINYRGRGIGTALLKFIVKAASESGYREIYGNLPVSKRATDSNLKQWYQKQGFTVRPKGAFGNGSVHQMLVPGISEKMLEPLPKTNQVNAK